ncbi:hypothetical protein [Nocardia jejuensis]|uniref:hypothetical protein n=1 Tax=Nocardia jejuensis TaxID=328049 RepID=UPI0012F98F03|nr:hypothetical protein [Nocardia jejuensis]
MDTPARRDDEEARKLALAPTDNPRFLHHSDGSWSLIGEDGWLYNPADMDADALESLVEESFPVINVDPTSVVDRELAQDEENDSTPM